MRLLKLEPDNNFSLIEVVGASIPPYAILSHTWGAISEEVTLRDILEGTGKDKQGYRKLLFCEKRARHDNLQYIWIDTCCIDKSSSAELSEAINSMFRWYRNAEKCYVYLSDVLVSSDGDAKTSWEPAFHTSRWFTRGWTLQELIAPTTVEFFSVEGARLGDRKSVEKQICNITGVAVEALEGGPLSQFTVEERMKWAAKRETTREEDAAYSLLGIFDIHMPLLYGEGRKKALARLHKEIRISQEDSTPASLDIKPKTKDKIQQRQRPSYSSISPLHNSPISAAYLSKTKLEVWVLGSDRKLKHIRLETGSWLPSYWQTEDGFFSNAPVIISRGEPELEILAPTAEGQLFYQAKQNTWFAKSQWKEFEGPITSPITAVSWSPSRLDIFAMGPTNQVNHKIFEYDDWLPSEDTWEALRGDGFAASCVPEVICSPSGFMNLFMLGKDRSLWQQVYEAGSWGPKWHWHGGYLQTPVTVVCSHPHHVDIFGIQKDNQVAYKKWDGAWWSGWTALGGSFSSRPAVVSCSGGRLDIFGLGTDHRIHHKIWKDEKWEPWVSLGGDFVCAPTAVCYGSERMDVFCKGRDNEIYHMNFEPIDEIRDRQWRSIGKVA